MLAIALLTYALITPRDSFTHGSFNSDDVQIIREAYGPHVFWFRSDDGTYLIFDEKALAQLDELFDRSVSSPGNRRTSARNRLTLPRVARKV